MRTDCQKNILARLVGILAILLFFMQEQHHVVSQKNLDEDFYFWQIATWAKPNLGVGALAFL